MRVDWLHLIFYVLEYLEHNYDPFILNFILLALVSSQSIFLGFLDERVNGSRVYTHTNSQPIQLNTTNGHDHAFKASNNIDKLRILEMGRKKNQHNVKG